MQRVALPWRESVHANLADGVGRDGYARTRAASAAVSQQSDPCQEGRQQGRNRWVCAEECSRQAIAKQQMTQLERCKRRFGWRCTRLRMACANKQFK